MAKKLFKKGHPKIAGRKKGTPNKFTTLKDAFIGAFKDIGGQDALVKFARTQKNQRELFKMVAHMLPRDVHVSGAEGAPLIPPVIQVQLVGSDGNGNPSTTNPDADSTGNKPS
jgi:hypothetical protein